MFRDRTHAGTLLAEELGPEYEGRSDAVVLGIPRGGVIVAAEIARQLRLPLDVLVTSKIGAPGNPEYAVGAVDPDGAVAQNVYAGYTPDELERLSLPVREKIAARLERYRPGRPAVELAGDIAIVVDDGIATGLTAVAAVDYVRRHGAGKVVLATPVIAAGAAGLLRRTIDELVTLAEPELFYAVGQFYRHFEQVDDSEVLAALAAK